MGFSIPFCGTQNKDIVVLIKIYGTQKKFFDHQNSIFWTIWKSGAKILLSGRNKDRR